MLAFAGVYMQEFGPLAQLLLHFSPDTLLVVDAGGITRFANETAESAFGYPLQQLIGQPVELLIPERFRSRHAAHVRAFMHGPAGREMGARVVDLFARRADGTEFPAGIRLAPFPHLGTTYVAVAVRDMTERRLISNALVAAREEADRANRAKSRFLAAASHDLRQPMQVIRLLNASLLKLVPDNAGVRDLLYRQEQSIDAASNLLNALLDISRLESGAIEPDLSAVDLAGVFAELQREFEPSATAKNLVLSIEPTAVRLMTDRTMFVQLLQNLIGNALKYTDHGAVRITHSVDPDGLMLNIEDTGIGIPEDKLSRIFDEYYQVDTRAGTKRLGVGLGLAIVREVARILGFTVAVGSRLGEGTQVRVRIPRQQLLPDERVVAHEKAMRPPAPAPVRRCSILLVEDNPSVRAATELFLGLEGFGIRSAAGLAEAEAMIADLKPGDILITDFRFSNNVTGLDIVSLARSRHAFRVPAVLLSGDLDAMMRVIREPLPDCRFLSKPVDVDAMLGALAELGG
ncbi:MAG: ATP-binding protein [Steroidobacterales bacterium]